MGGGEEENKEGVKEWEEKRKVEQEKKECSRGRSNVEEEGYEENKMRRKEDKEEKNMG